MSFQIVGFQGASQTSRNLYKCRSCGVVLDPLAYGTLGTMASMHQCGKRGQQVRLVPRYADDHVAISYEPSLV